MWAAAFVIGMIFGIIAAIFKLIVRAIKEKKMRKHRH